MRALVWAPMLVCFEAAGLAGQPNRLQGEAEFLQCRKVPAGKKVAIRLKPDADVDDLVGLMSAMTCTSIVAPQSLQQRKVRLLAPEPVTAEEAYRLFLSALHAVGLTVLPAAGGLAVEDAARAHEAAPVYVREDALPADESYVTQLVRLRNVAPSEMAPLLERLRSKDAQVTPYDPGGTLIVMDTAANVRRMIEVVQALDVPGSVEKIWILKVLRGSAAAMVDRLAQIFPPASAPGPARPGGSAGAAVPRAPEPTISRMLADERSQSIVLLATDEGHARVRAVLDRLQGVRSDGDDAGEDTWFHAYPLVNANADELAQTLAALTGAQVTSPPAGQPAPGRTARSDAAGAGGLGPPPPSRASGAASLGAAPGGFNSPFDGEVRIVPDHASNLLLVLASARDFAALRGLLRKLDAPRRQVLIEATIVEVSLERSRDLAASLHAASPVGRAGGDGAAFGGSNAATTLGLATSVGQQALLGEMGQGLSLGVAGTPFEALPGVSIPSFGVFLRALATSTEVHVLSQPQLMTLDNEPARIVVGRNLPFPGAATVAPATTTTAGPTLLAPAISVDRRDVALDLKITPQIAEGGLVRLRVEQEVSDVDSDNFNNLGPATSKRRIETVVAVDDQHPVVLGGLITEHTEHVDGKVPFLGDIPLLGFFFKTSHKVVRKSNLLLFVTPYVIRDRGDLKRIYEQKERERRDFLERESAFRDRDLAIRIDYRRKRGLLEEINRAARAEDEESTRLAALRRQAARPPESDLVAPAAGPVETPP